MKENSGSNKSAAVLGAKLCNEKAQPEDENLAAAGVEVGASVLFQPPEMRQLMDVVEAEIGGRRCADPCRFKDFFKSFSSRSYKIFFSLFFLEATLPVLTIYAFNFHSLREYFQALNICCHVFKLHHATLLTFLEFCLLL